MPSTKLNLWALAVSLAVSGAISGCSNDRTTNPKIAELYEQFYETGPSNPAESRRAIAEAIAADPENAYSLYLRASLEAKDTPDQALETIRTGNGLSRCVIYVSAPPPEDSMRSLTRIRGMSALLGRDEIAGERLPEWAAALRTMGRRVAQAEPTASLAVLNGTAVVRAAYRAEIRFWEDAKQPDRAQALKEGLDRFEQWHSEMQAGLSATLKDLVREAARQAGMDERETALYAAGKNVGDNAKQAKANRAKEAMFRREIEVLRAFLAKMPDVDGEPVPPTRP
ncbi:MAG: hypothetical protein SNJ74_12235 [Fimbriimonadaceae bacterium]